MSQDKLLAPLRDGVFDPQGDPTEEFLQWCKTNQIQFDRDGRDIYLSSQDDLTLYLLRWTEEVPLATIMLPLVMRAMPQLIANEIIGVQPMTAPSSSIFAMRARYAEIFDDTAKSGQARDGTDTGDQG